MIKFIRSIGVVFMFGFFGICALIVRYLVFPLQKSKQENYKTLHKSWRFFVWLLQSVKLIDLKINNPEKIKNIKNSIIVSTHPSFIDILILMSVIPNSTCFVAKKLAKNPFFKGIVELLFILDSDNMDTWLEECSKKLDEGLNLIIFPMGTRHFGDEQPKIKRGTSLIALKTKKNIVALDIRSNTKFLYVNQPIYDAGDKPIEYAIDYLDKINTEEYLEKYPDEVTFKSELTKKIGKILYKK